MGELNLELGRNLEHGADNRRRFILNYTGAIEEFQRTKIQIFGQRLGSEYLNRKLEIEVADNIFESDMRAVRLEKDRNITEEVESHEPEQCDTVHAMTEILVSFENISQKILRSFTANRAKTIIIAFDHYVSPSIRDDEHIMRGRVEGNRFTINGPQQKRSSNFKNDLNNTYFKEALFEVIDNKIVRTVEEDLSCFEHLEADSKISFHVCQLNFDAHVTIRCSDTDIIIVIMLDCQEDADGDEESSDYDDDRR
ncbi:unnamed protein product [Ceutorhynchus assimilis]|uniref:Uncharacterized protein n=1 Tax=Ceutorhynchus assimilis TaxID=467358 RepID=A0A9N9MY02_9CUCU|nr:unnamed protein product [Ceutorhynchus assimilis]